jgi:AraC-like DNA-binding protein
MAGTFATRHRMTREQLARRLELRGRAVGIPGVNQIGRYRYTAAYEHLRTQTHPGDLEICFLARGRQTYRVKNSLYQLRGGDQYLVFPGEPHDSAGFPEEKGELYWLGLRIRPARTSLLFLDADASAALRRALLALPSRHFTAEPGLRDLWEEILNGLRKARSKIERLAAAAAIQRLLLATLRASHRNQLAQPSPRIQRCLDHIAARVHEPLYVPALARLIGLSESRFKVRFRREVGLPPGEYILRVKIAAATAALAQPGARVTELAHTLGFSSSQYFATVFRRFTGLSPTAYQARHQTGKTA